MIKIFISSFLIIFSIGFVEGQVVQRQRIIVLTDIEADPDDTQSLIRLLLYANQIDIEGLVATTSVHMKTGIHPESIHKVLDAYGIVRDNLQKHEKGFPDVGTLKAVVKKGAPVYGLAALDSESEGSEWIIAKLLEKDSRPLWISAWGGPNTLAQALYKLRKTKTSRELNELVKKLRVYTISDQDDTGAWLRKNFPDLFYIVSPGGYSVATWTAINTKVRGISNEEISNSWLTKNIQQGHGPLGRLYPDVAYGMEGDTPAWLSLIPNGLNVPERPDWGGWGGRYEKYIPKLEDTDPKGFTGGVPVEKETRAIWTNAVDRYQPYRSNEWGINVKLDSLVFEDNKVSLWRWRTEIQNDFAARMDWCIAETGKANHPPVVILNHPDTIYTKSGDYFGLDASKSTDPDGDNLSFLWFQYPEPGTLKELIKINLAVNLSRIPIQAPKVEGRKITHFIVKVTDKGSPALSRYKRVVVVIN